MERRRIALDELDLTLGRLRRLPEGEVSRMVASLGSKGQLSAVVAARQGPTGSGSIEPPGITSDCGRPNLFLRLESAYEVRAAGDGPGRGGRGPAI